MTVTADICYDGKKHKWRELNSDYFASDVTGEVYITYWCSKCGSITQYIYADGDKIRCLDGTKKYIKIPKCFETDN